MLRRGSESPPPTNEAARSLESFPKPLPRTDYTRCKDCDRHASECGQLSHQRLCVECGDRRRREAAIDLANHSGPKFQAWRRGMAASVGAAFLDDRQLTP